MSRLLLSSSLVVLLVLGAGVRSLDGQEVPERMAWEDVPIQIGDVIRLAVWREPAYTGDFPVSARGTATLPRVGEWEVVGEAPSELRRRLTEVYSRNLRDPVISLEVLRRVRILGEVAQPGVRHLDATMSVADAVAMAGGRTPLARRGEVILRRGDQVLRSDVQAEVLLAELPIQSGDELFVPQRGWLDRNAPVLISSTLGFVGVLIAVFGR